MRVKTGQRGFVRVVHPEYPNTGEETRLVQQSSIIGNDENSWDIPGSSYLWIGADHHLNREEVRQLIKYLARWCATGRL